MEKINTSELIRTVSSETNVPMTVVKQVLNNIVDHISLEAKKGSAVTISGLGTFKPVDKVARTCRNPATGGTIEVLAKRALTFKAAAGNKDI